MAIIVNTNVSSLKAQNNLTKATNSLSQSLERLSTGYKVNTAKDDAAGMFISAKMATQISGSKVALANMETGQNVLNTVEATLDAIAENVNRIRDLAVQASNGIYETTSTTAMTNEITARLAEITRLQSAKFNGLSLFSATGLGADGLKIQVGPNSGDQITVANTNFTQLGTLTAAVDSVTNAQTAITNCDTLLGTINSRKAAIGAVGSQLDSARSSLTTTIENLSAAHSTIMDADIAEESANYTRARILQQTTSTLLVQANALPSIALTLIGG